MTTPVQSPPNAQVLLDPSGRRLRVVQATAGVIALLSALFLGAVIAGSLDASAGTPIDSSVTSPSSDVR